MAREQLNPMKPVKGMVRDSSPLNQPENTYRMGLNLLMESREGNYSSLSTEEGNSRCFPIGVDYDIIGTIIADNDDVAIFSTNGTISRIGIASANCEYQLLVESSCLNFNKNFPITGEFRIANGCNRVLYFTDNNNPLRAINIDFLQFYTVGGIPAEDANATDAWECEFFKFHRDFQVPNFGNVTVNNGGGTLKVGSYQFAIRYLDNFRNPTNWAYVTQPVNVGEGTVTNASAYDGGNFDIITQGLSTNKSITLPIQNLDQNFQFYQLAIVERTLSNGFDTVAYLAEAEEITGVNIEYTYRGDLSRLTNYTVDEIATPLIIFNKVKELAQIDNRMVVANTQEPVRDWAVFQRAVSQMYMTWERVAADLEEINGLAPGPAGGNHSFRVTGYMRDEVYCLGVYFKFTDGTISPVFNIPGRPANFAISTGGVVHNNANLSALGNANLHTRNQVPLGAEWDRQILTVRATVVDPTTEVSEVDVRHIPTIEFETGAGLDGSTIQRWKVFNTAVATNGLESGVMGFYETEELYPNREDCDGVDIWGNDIEGNPLLGQKIRHHMMPDTTLSQHRSDIVSGLVDPPLTGTTSNIHIRANNLVYPSEYASEIEGYYIVRVERDESNKTVLDKGMLGFTQDITDISTPGPDRGLSTFMHRAAAASGITDPESLQTMLFVSPRSMFDKSIQPTTYFKFEKKFSTDHGSTGWAVKNYSNQPDFNRNIQSYAYVEADSVQPIFGSFVENLQNQLGSIDLLFVRLQDPITDMAGDPNTGDYPYVSLKRWLRPYGNLFSLRYIRTSNRIETSNGVNSASSRIAGGDCYITELTFRSSQVVDPPSFSGKVFQNLFCESDYNCALRMHGTGQTLEHFRYTQLSSADYLDVDNAIDDPGIQVTPEYFQLNYDMSVDNTIIEYFPITEVFDFCDPCEGTFPYRIWYSDRSYQEDVSDNYRLFRANNYRDLLGNSGEITGIAIYKDDLYAHTERATWFIPTRPQQLTTNENNVIIGTGDVLQIPPKRLATVERGYAGSQDKLSTQVTEGGMFFVDADAGKIFLFNKGQGLQEISAKGLRNWFAEYGPIQMLRQNPDFVNTSIINKNGVGYIATFDPRHNRYILRKKDYRLLIDPSTVLWTDEYEDTTGFQFGYNSTTGEFFTKNGVNPENLIDIQNASDITEQLNWTMSFSLNGNGWISYHSYFPEWMWHSRNAFYTYDNKTVDNGTERYAWVHGTRNFAEFYEETKPTILELVFNKAPLYTKVFNSIQYQAETETFSGEDTIKDFPDTFDRAFFYTSNQASKLLDVASNYREHDTNPFVEVSGTFDNCRASFNEDEWNLSGFYDFVTDRSLPLITSDWNNLEYRTQRVNNGIPYYPNTDAIDDTKESFQIEHLRDKWLGVWMIYDNETNDKAIIDFTSTIKNISFK